MEEKNLHCEHVVAQILVMLRRYVQSCCMNILFFKMTETKADRVLGGKLGIYKDEVF